MLHAVKHVNGAVLWANLHLLFWLSLIPFTTGWMGENHFAPLPVALYGVVLLMAGVAYYILVRALIALPRPRFGIRGRDRPRLEGQDLRWSSTPPAIGLAFVNVWISLALYVGHRGDVVHSGSTVRRRLSTGSHFLTDQKLQTPRHYLLGVRPLRSLKNSWITARHSSSSTPPIASSR